MLDLRCQNVVCNLCGGNESKYLFTAHSFDVVKCLNCGLVYLNPMPVKEDISKIYDTSEYYRNDSEQADIPIGYSDYMILEGHLAFVADELLHPLRNVKAGKLLDVGCGMGFMLNRFRELGWDTCGVDISTYASEHARNKLGLKVYTGVPEELNLPENYFDLVTIVLAIEHMPNPKGTLERLHSLIKPGGIIVVTTHDIDGLWPRIIKDRWRHFNIPEHLHFFSKGTLKRMLEKAGFSTFRVTETATVSSVTSDCNGLCTPVRLLHRYGLIKKAAPWLRSWHRVARLLNLADGVTTYSLRV